MVFQHQHTPTKVLYTLLHPKGSSCSASLKNDELRQGVYLATGTCMRPLNTAIYGHFGGMPNPPLQKRKGTSLGPASMGICLTWEFGGVLSKTYRTLQNLAK